MAGQGLAARRKRRRRGTTRPGKGRWRAADLVKRDFPAQKINTKWYGDGTEIKTGQGKLCRPGPGTATLPARAVACTPGAPPN